MSSRLRWREAALCLSILLSACGGPEEGRRRGGTEQSPAPPVTPGPRGETGPAPLILTPVTPSVPPANSPAPRPGPGARRPAAPGAAPAPAPPGAGPVAPSPAVPGNYLFAETGITRIRGCLTLDQPPASPSKLAVGAATGNRQHFERDQRDPLGSGSLTAADLEYRADGIYLTFLRQTQTSLLSSEPTEFQPAAPVLLLPAGATAGQGWSFSLVSRDGRVKIDSQNRVEALDEPVTTGSGRVVSTRKVLADSRITGQSSQGTLELNRKMTTWYAPENGLPVKEVVDMKGRVGLCEIDSHIESTLQSP